MFEQRLFSVCQLGRRQVILATSKQEIRIGQKAGIIGDGHAEIDWEGGRRELGP